MNAVKTTPKRAEIEERGIAPPCWQCTTAAFAIDGTRVEVRLTMLPARPLGRITRWLVARIVRHVLRLSVETHVYRHAAARRQAIAAAIEPSRN